MNPVFPYPQSVSVQPSAGIGIALMLVFVLVGIVFQVLNVLIWWKIMGRTGWPGALGLLVLFPPAVFVLTLVLAFVEWPVQRDLRLAKQQPAIAVPSRQG